ncbi:MAG: hypothetical protein PG981_001520 [Wolbachia endosymbiont of Ctenocephalides orientis wCori]|nr:MAG: hypothetical protein PG981_001520 [Wolbachia endosymbiont of Ctenocephalides orientis wCori]
MPEYKAIVPGFICKIYKNLNKGMARGELFGKAYIVVKKINVKDSLNHILPREIIIKIVNYLSNLDLYNVTEVGRKMIEETYAGKVSSFLTDTHLESLAEKGTCCSIS